MIYTFIQLILTNRSERASNHILLNHYRVSLCSVAVTCGNGTDVASLETTGLISVNEDLRAWDPHYAVRAMVDGDLLVLNWSPTESMARGVDRNGEAVEVRSWQQMVFEPRKSHSRGRCGGRTPGGRNSTLHCHVTVVS